MDNPLIVILSTEHERNGARAVPNVSTHTYDTYKFLQHIHTYTTVYIHTSMSNIMATYLLSVFSCGKNHVK